MFIVNIFILIINGNIIIISISNKMKIIIINIKFIEKFIFLLFKLLKPHSILFNIFFFLLKLLINLYIDLIIKIIIIKINIEFIYFILLKLIIFNVKNTYV